MWILKAVLPTGLAVEWCVLTFRSLSPLVHCSLIYSPWYRQHWHPCHHPNHLKTSFKRDYVEAGLQISAAHLKQGCLGGYYWIIKLEAQYDPSGTRLAALWGAVSTAVPLDWAVPCCPPSPELLQSHLGVTTLLGVLGSPWNSIKIHQDLAFLLMSGEMLLLNKHVLKIRISHLTQVHS